MFEERTLTVFDGFKFHRFRLWICVSTRLELNHLCSAFVLLQRKDVSRRAFSDEVLAFVARKRVGSSQRIDESRERRFGGHCDPFFRGVVRY